MAGLVPAIHVLDGAARQTWMPGTSPGMTISMAERQDDNHFGTTAVASISTRAAFSTSRTTCTSAIAG